MSNSISLQTGIRQYNGDLSKYTGVLGGLTPDVHTLRSLNPETTNRVICVMYRGPYFLMHYFAGDGNNAYDAKNEFGTYKKIIEYYNTGITCNIQDATLGTTTLQGGFAGRSIAIPTTQNAQTGQSLTIQVPELVGRPVANFHNMWVDGISDNIMGLTTYHGLVAGSEDPTTGKPQRIFSPAANSGGSDIALEPSPAYEVAEFLIIALDRSGARAEGAVMALGCVPSAKVGNDIFTASYSSPQSQVQSLQLTYNCQFVQSAYVNDLATRYLKQFAIFGNSLNYNPGAGDAFFQTQNSTQIDTAIFNGGKRPSMDSVQSGVGNAPVFQAENQAVVREGKTPETLTPAHHSQLWGSNDTGFEAHDISDPYSTTNGNG